MLIHVPRVALAILRGRAQRAGASAGVGFATPHVYTARAGLAFDTDFFGHMNNSAYLVHCELARWEMTAASGLLDYVLREKAAFIVGMTAIRYRREIKPLQRFEIHSQMVAHDDKWMTIEHQFRNPGSEDLLATTMVRACLKQKGGSLSPRTMLRGLGIADADTAPEPRPELKEVLDSMLTLDGALKRAAQKAAPPRQP
ncbi:HotDog domain-containing protein [Pavlovales sp. CCMP2436]|nr:HotDog domain-containing protein [Pavlovales sp. CCMP2436]